MIKVFIHLVMNEHLLLVGSIMIECRDHPISQFVSLKEIISVTGRPAPSWSVMRAKSS